VVDLSHMSGVCFISDPIAKNLDRIVSLPPSMGNLGELYN